MKRLPIGQVDVLNHGFVALIDKMGDDRTPAQTARTSFLNQKERSVEEDAKLTNYLVSHHHNTPLEFVQLLFYMKMPIFVARQLVRHRTASINEVSLRYVKAAKEFYVPDIDRCQQAPTHNKQGSSDQVIELPDLARELIINQGDRAYQTYEQLLQMGLATEIARSVLPLGTYTEWYWQCDLHNTLKLLKLRLDKHAQYETRVYAEAMLDLISPHYPTIIEAWAKTL